MIYALLVNHQLYIVFVYIILSIGRIKLTIIKRIFENHLIEYRPFKDSDNSIVLLDILSITLSI